MITKGYQDVPMTRRRAQLLEEYAGKLADMLEAAPNDKDLAEWVQAKIDRAAAAIQSAYHYLDQGDLEKAVGHKYTHRKLVGRDPKTNRARYRYYYAEHQGGGISRAKFEAGSAFKLTWKGRRGHFHIQRVEGDKVFISHDSRPDMEPVPIQADELRALLKKQHSKAERKHVEKRQRKVEEIKRRAHRGGLGLALHRLRQAAAQAGVSLPEQYQRKPKKTRAPVAETSRENFDTMPEVETPRDQLTSAAQQIIEEANQEHEERHEEHQEITRFELGEHVHTKTGAKLYTAKQTERVDRDEYFRRVEIAKKYRGRYERRYVRGFVFQNADDARAFALEVEGAAQEAPETSAETVTPHEDHPSADNFETMPEVESAEDRTRGDLKSKQQALDLLRRSEQERQALTETAEKIISEPPPAPAVQADFDTDAIQEAIDNGHELTPVTALQRQFIERRNAGLLTPALLKESLRIYETMIEKGVEAKVKKKKKGVLLNYIASNISAMTAYRLKSEKKQEAVEEMMSSFIRNVTNTPLMKERRNNVTYNIFDLQDRETDIERIKRLVSEYTEEDAIEDNRRLKAEIAQAEQQRAEKERVQANPQTAQDYIELKRLKRNKGEELSAEQHAKHNDLISRSRREKRETDKPRQAERQKAKRDALRERLEGYRDNANEALNADRRTNTARRARFARYATEDAFRRIEYVNKSQRVLDAIDEGRAYHLKNISNATDLDMLQSIIDRAKSDEASAQGQQWSDYEKTRDKLKAAPIPQNALESRDLYPDKLQLFSADIKSLKKYLTRKDGTARRGARTALAELNAMLSEPKEKRHTVSMDTLTRVLSHVPPETDKSYGVLSRVVELKRDHDRMKRLGIENELELKAALREYEDIVYQRSPEDERAHKEAEQAKAERDRLIRRGEFARMNIPSYFPTPASVIDRMIEIAGIEEGETVLEPSAGAGHILEKLADTKASVKAIEANITLRDYLQDQGHEVVGNDSLEHSDTYDHVIMNPPFEKQADIDHVTHAFENNLVEGGRLVAVMSASAMTRDNKKARDFQELVNKYGQYEKLPQGTFKDSDRQTGVNTILVTLDLPTKGLRKGMRQPIRATKNSHRAQLVQTVERLTAA
jgi:protein-L-isoaspartate O-methyltransferase